MDEIILSEKQKIIFDESNHLLVIGGPGSGKTTISILKALNIAESLQEGQQIIFLSFARATVTRIIERLNKYSNFNKNTSGKIKIETYHSFFWRLIKSFGYLLGLPRNLTVLTPHSEAIALSIIRHQYSSFSPSEERQKNKVKDENKIREELAMNNGEISFALFASFVYMLLTTSKKIRNLINEKYPYIILDEFQDTNKCQWKVIELLGENSKLVALADPEQRIYDFIGADPNRLEHFKIKFKPKEIYLGDENYRNPDTDIFLFGKQILDESFSKNTYHGIDIVTFNSNKKDAFAVLKYQTLLAIQRLNGKSNVDWSIAILVPTKKLMREVSNFFFEKQGATPIIEHSVPIDTNIIMLAVEIYAFFLQPSIKINDQALFIELVCRFFEGKGGDSPTNSDMKEAVNIKTAYKKFQDNNMRASNKRSIINPLIKGYKLARNIIFTGNITEDWKLISSSLMQSECKRLRKIMEEVKNIRLLNRGTQLREALSDAWREYGNYFNATDIFKKIIQQEYFSTSPKYENGVLVMNMHKSKGKQFDEVIIFEGWPQRKNREIVANGDRIVKRNLKVRDLTAFKYIFRVSVTRGVCQQSCRMTF